VPVVTKQIKYRRFNFLLECYFYTNIVMSDCCCSIYVAIAFTIVLFVPAHIWAAVVSGLYRVVLDREGPLSAEEEPESWFKEPVVVYRVTQGE